MKAIQDYYPEDFSHCYGCGRLNEEGHQIKTIWKGDETETLYTPKESHMAIPGFVYGGVLASIIDCHGTGSGALALARERGIELKDGLAPRCVTASLNVKYHKPTPLGTELKLVGSIREILKNRKVIVDTALYANDILTVSGEIVVVEMPEGFGK